MYEDSFLDTTLPSLSYAVVMSCHYTGTADPLLFCNSSFLPMAILVLYKFHFKDGDTLAHAQGPKVSWWIAELEAESKPIVT